MKYLMFALFFISMLFLPFGFAEDTPLLIIQGDSPVGTEVAFSPDGVLLASGGGSGNGNTIQLWHPETGERIATLEGHTDWLTALTFSPDGKTLASASWDR